MLLFCSSMASVPSHYSLHVHSNCVSSSLSPRLVRLRDRELSRRFSAAERVRVFGFREKFRSREKLVCWLCKASADIEKGLSIEEETQRPPFDVNLAVILAGFAFEAYTSPSDNVGRRQVDAAGCETVFLSESFVREIYDGQIFVKLKEGFDLPVMDLWGTSDPYVVMELDGQIAKSSTKWGNKEPKWNENFTFYARQTQKSNLKVAAWDANLVTPHQRMGNAGLSLESLVDGNLHEVVVDLEGIGGGGKLKLEVKYKTFEEIEVEKQWWRLPFVSEFLRKNGLESAMNVFSGSKPIQARQFVESAFGQLKSFNDAYLGKDWTSSIPENGKKVIEKLNQVGLGSDKPLQIEGSEEDPPDETVVNNGSYIVQIDSKKDSENGQSNEGVPEVGRKTESEKYFWKEFSDVINHNVVEKLGLANVMNQNVIEKLGLPTPEKLKSDGFDLLNKAGLQSRKIAEAIYIESGLAIPQHFDKEPEKKSGSFDINAIGSSLPDIKKATEDLLKQTDSVFGALMVLTSAIPELNIEASLPGKIGSKQEGASTIGDDGSRYVMNELLDSQDGPVIDEKKVEEMREIFSSAESAMEAWAMLATSLGHPSFIKSEFEKICFLENDSTDTQVAIWRDSSRKRLVVAFRGTEQSRWKDLKTDLMIVPAGLNPERIGGDFKQEVQVHTGFLSAYDSARIRILSLIKQAIDYNDDSDEPPVKWHVYVTGHSLGGALATLLALELSSSQLAKCGAISVTMYNFGSPRVGNKRFAEIYNQKVKDSWRVVNHRDIIPTVPRLMGYCHVAQPVYLSAGDLKLALENLELLGDGYHGDVIGEYTPDVLVNEFMKGEKELIEKILQTEINIFRAIRDGSALMQHMEDFYYITLLENVRSNYSTTARSSPTGQGNPTIGQG